MRKHRHNNWYVVVASAAAIAVVGFVIGGGSGALPEHSEEGLVQQEFQQAVAMLHTRQFEQAKQGFQEVLALRSKLPEAHVNMGFALLGLKQYEAAIAFFNSATDLRPSQYNAYFGLAVANEELGNLRDAIAAMQAFVHVAPESDAHVRRAEAAIWEWQAAIAEQDK